MHMNRRRSKWMKRAESTACVNGAWRGVVDRYSRINDRWRCATWRATDSTRMRTAWRETAQTQIAHTCESGQITTHSLHRRPPPGLLRVVTIISPLLTERPSQFYRMDQIPIYGIGVIILELLSSIHYELRNNLFYRRTRWVKCYWDMRVWDT